MRTRPQVTRDRRPEAGQGLVEFSLAITVFLVLIMGIVDLGRLAYQYNGVAEVARELARTAGVYPGTPLGTSSQSAATLSGQRGLVPELGTPTYTCVDLSGATVTHPCLPGDWVRVTISSAFHPATPLAGLIGSPTLTSTASSRIE